MFARAAAIVLMLLVLPACGGGSPSDEEDVGQESAPSPVATAPVVAVDPASTNTGLTPLPSAGDVIEAIELGRADPFAPIEPRQQLNELLAAQREAEAIRASIGIGTELTPEQRAAQLAAIEEAFRPLEITGFVRGRGGERVLLAYKGFSGDVAEGYMGGAGRRLLPPGWTVEDIRAETGVVIFRNGNLVAERRIL